MTVFPPATVAALGTEAHLLTALGDCVASAFMERWMVREGVRLDHCPRLTDARVAVFFMVRGAKRYSRLGSAASRLGPEDLHVPFASTDVLHTFGGTSQMLSPSTRAAVAEAVRRARNAGALVSYNLNDRPDLRESPEELVGALAEVAPAIDLLFVGVGETNDLFQLGLPPSATAEDSARSAGEVNRLLTACCPHLKCLFVTDGPFGVHLFQRHQSPRHLAATLIPPEAVVQPVGAGDAFVGGTLHGVLHGLPFHRAAEIGMVTSQLNTLGHGAVVIPDRDRVHQHLSDHFGWPAQLLRRI